MKTRICFIHNQLVMGGAEKALLDLVTLLDKTKYDITILVLEPGGVLENDFKKIGINVVNPYSFMNCYMSKGVSKLICKAKTRLVDKAMGSGGKHLVDLLFYKQFDIVVSYHLYSDFQYICFAKGAKSIKYIHCNAETNTSYGRDLLKQIDTLNKYDRIICVSDDAKKAFVRFTGIDRNVTSCYNPINIEAIRDLSEHDIDITDANYLLSVGRLHREKGFLRLIKVYKKIVDEGCKDKLYIIGEGPQREELEKEIINQDLSNYVQLVGQKNNTYPYIKNSKLFVISSYTEGMPVVAMESLCLGVPIVSSFKPIEELFGNECCGVLTDSDDESLYEGLFSVLNDEKLYNQIRDGANKQKENISSKSMIGKVEKIYDYIL